MRAPRCCCCCFHLCCCAGRACAPRTPSARRPSSPRENRSSLSLARKRRERSPSALRTARAPGLFTAIDRCRGHLCTRFMHRAARPGVASALLAHVPALRPGLSLVRLAHRRSHSCARSLRLGRRRPSPSPSRAQPRLISLLRRNLAFSTVSPNSPAILDRSALKLQLPVCARRRRRPRPDRPRRLAQGSPHAPSPLRRFPSESPPLVSAASILAIIFATF